MVQATLRTQYIQRLYLIPIMLQTELRRQYIQLFYCLQLILTHVIVCTEKTIYLAVLLIYLIPINFIDCFEKTIYLAVLLLVSHPYLRCRLHGEDNIAIKRYVISFWNGVDLRYRLLKGPSVKISIAGIIISRVSQLSYESRSQIKTPSKTLLIAKLLVKGTKIYI